MLLLTLRYSICINMIQAKQQRPRGSLFSVGEVCIPAQQRIPGGFRQAPRSRQYRLQNNRHGESERGGQEGAKERRPNEVALDQFRQIVADPGIESRPNETYERAPLELTNTVVFRKIAPYPRFDATKPAHPQIWMKAAVRSYPCPAGSAVLPPHRTLRGLRLPGPLPAGGVSAGKRHSGGNPCPGTSKKHIRA